MPSEVNHETPVSIINIVVPLPLNPNDGEYTDTDSFHSDFECSSEEITINLQKSHYADIESLSETSESTETETSEDSALHINAKKIFITALLQFEENITWKAVKEEFKGVRSNWRRRVNEVSTVADASKILIEFSKYLLPSAINNAEYIYDTWEANTISPIMSFNTLCGMLLALEYTLNGSSSGNTFSSSWANRVDGWRERLEEAEDECGYESDDLFF